MTDVHVGDKVSFAYGHSMPMRSTNVEFNHRCSKERTEDICNLVIFAHPV